MKAVPILATGIYEYIINSNVSESTLLTETSTNVRIYSNDTFSKDFDLIIGIAHSFISFIDKNWFEIDFTPAINYQNWYNKSFETLHQTDVNLPIFGKFDATLILGNTAEITRQELLIIFMDIISMTLSLIHTRKKRYSLYNVSEIETMIHAFPMTIFSLSFICPIRVAPFLNPISKKMVNCQSKIALISYYCNFEQDGDAKSFKTFCDRFFFSNIKVAKNKFCDTCFLLPSSLLKDFVLLPCRINALSCTDIYANYVVNEK